MSIYATSLIDGEFGVPGLGAIRGHETREVPMEVAAWLACRPEFAVRAEGDLPFKVGGAARYAGYFGPVDATFGYGGGGMFSDN